MLLDIPNVRARAAAVAGYIGAVEFYIIELAPLIDGNLFVSVDVTVCPCEGDLRNHQIACERVATIDDALAVIKASVLIASKPTAPISADLS